MQKFNAHRLTVLGLTLLLLPLLTQAHTINYALADKPLTHIFSYYFQLGFTHILPDGFDHVLFVVGLYLFSPKLRDIVWQATAFTVAHTITLILSMKNIIVAPPAIVEPIIALSIAFIAIENILLTKRNYGRVAVVFGFGLIHGMGFASALNELGLPPNRFVESLLSFNVGVEVGQLAVILACYFAFGRWFAEKSWYRPRIVYPMSGAIALIALFWTVQRLM
jgi:hypothetical protein